MKSTTSLRMKILEALRDPTSHTQLTRRTFMLGMGSLASASVLAAPELPTFGVKEQFNIQNSNAWMEVDAKAFQNNLQLVKKLLNGNSKICAIMKGNAYGHGVDLLMASIIKSGISCIGIASNAEAKVARERGFTGQILRVRVGTLAEIESGVPYSIEELVGDLEFAKQVSHIAKLHKKELSIHLSTNAGHMSRDGLEMSTDQGKNDALELIKLPGLKLVGIMTHFAKYDRSWIREALMVFNKQSMWLINEGRLDRDAITLHTASSFATFNIPEAHLDMVRPGWLIYGDIPDRYVKYFPGYQRVLSFKTRVASIQAYPAGETVGYGATFTLQRNSILANLPLGYADGYRRSFNNKAFVVVLGQRAPVVGMVSMNTTMIDVTDIHGVKPGDEVVLFGRQGAQEVTEGELEGLTGDLLADTYTMWGNSNPRFLKPVAE
ncbi:alanine racemase [Collimonas antrihumi]|uniref:alanine racemase n=1 Tax=Collimonas antrihumi TaxID=1940615 RepID=UPI001FEBC200|nr:alanine racemase [Collimonas antrihumi]